MLSSRVSEAGNEAMYLSQLQGEIRIGEPSVVFLVMMSSH